MCCSVTPRVRVNFSNTVLYGAEVLHPRDGEVVHVLGYQNKVQGQTGPSSMWDLLPWGGVGNAMILPFPAVPGSMTRANVIDTSGYRDVLQHVANAIPRPFAASGMLTLSRSHSPKPQRVEVFEAAGVYTVVLADNPRDIPAALNQVPRSKRPALNPELFDAYARWYPGWTVALCCFNTRKARLADPLLWWYRPMHPDRLFLPALDCHTGDVPDLEADVAVGHVVAVSSYRLVQGHVVDYKPTVPEHIAPYFRPFVLGERYHKFLPNGDFVCRVDEVADGKFNAERQRPPGASPSPPQPQMAA